VQGIRVVVRPNPELVRTTYGHPDAATAARAYARPTSRRPAVDSARRERELKERNTNLNVQPRTRDRGTLAASYDASPALNARTKDSVSSSASAIGNPFLTTSSASRILSIRLSMSARARTDSACPST
jgi:hypothetical protein